MRAVRFLLGFIRRKIFCRRLTTALAALWIAQKTRAWARTNSRNGSNLAGGQLRSRGVKFLSFSAASEKFWKRRTWSPAFMFAYLLADNRSRIRKDWIVRSLQAARSSNAPRVARNTSEQQLFERGGDTIPLTW